jgi:predicted phosphoribosyltransferase
MAGRRFRDRRDAGGQLAVALGAYAHRDDVVVLALPRGGVPVGYEIAVALDAPLDVLVVRKIGVPGHEELAVGAIASGGIRVIDRHLAERLRLSEERIAAVVQREAAELRRREMLYREGASPLPVRGLIVILVDDGLATGSTMLAAVEALRAQEPAKIVVAVPVAAPDVCERFARIADESVCLLTPASMMAVGYWYEDFHATSDDEVRRLLSSARERNDQEARLRS